MPQLSWYVEKLKNPIQPIRRWTVRQIAAKKGPRAVLNLYYGMLGDKAKSRFERRYGQVFRAKGLFGDQGAQLAPGEWTIRFNRRKIRLPLRPSWAWLDWETAVSAVGHDVEVIRTYEAIIRSEQRPSLFLDVGANYGMHSVLFLSAGIPVMAFEPNPTCFAHFKAMCELNRLPARRWEQVAIGNSPGEIELVYPEKESWLGSVSREIVPKLRERDARVVTRRVPMKTLDDYLADVPKDNVLIALDVEGFEPEVILGAPRLLRQCRPKIIFESLDATSRPKLFELFMERGYSIHALPWRPGAASRPMSAIEFFTGAGVNFIALPDSVH
jgi:FkbM family methyltransferase